jgi:ABC-2 type transport system permease protein
MNAGTVTKYTWIGYTAVRSNLAYLGEVASRTTFMAVILYIFMRLWTVVYSGNGSQRLGGLTLKEMIWYLMITESLHLSSARISTEVDEDVRTGRLAVQLLRPLSYSIARMAQGLGERSVRFAVNFLTGIVIATLLVGPLPSSAGSVAMFAVVLPLAFIVEILGFLAIGLCAFWLESTSGLTLIYMRLTMLLGGMLLPVELFPSAIQSVVRWLPFAAVVYAPARLFVSGDSALFYRTMAILAATLLLYSGLVWLVQRAALRQVYSNGG